VLVLKLVLMPVRRNAQHSRQTGKGQKRREDDKTDKKKNYRGAESKEQRAKTEGPRGVHQGRTKTKERAASSSRKEEKYRGV
jgi:hypothetical protein